MRKIYLSLSAIMIALMIAIGMSVRVKAAENESATTDEVIAVAVNMIMNTRQFEDGVKEPFSIRNIDNIYDLTGEVVSYYVTLNNLSGNFCGYVIVSANKTDNPIMEFANSTTSFFEEAIDSIGNAQDVSKLYISDGIYGVRTDVIYEITNAGCVQMDENTLISVNNLNDESEKDVAKNKDMWNEQINRYNSVYKEDNIALLSDDPRDDGNIIYYPDNYETVDARTNIVPGGDIPYFRMVAFGQGGICSPVVATNLCYYWYRRDSSHFSGLYRDSWQNVCNIFIDYMETNLESGTDESNLYNAYTWYFNEAGIGYNLNYYTGTHGGMDIVNEVDEGYPAHLNMHDHKVYKYHSVLAVGYNMYEYDAGDSIYIKIVDGWGENGVAQLPNRYVWGGCHGTWSYVSFHPYGY